MRGRICLAMVFFLFLIMNPASALKNVDVFLVEHVDDYGKFIPKTGSYGIGDTVKIYAQAEGVNHRRAYAVDFVFVIYDPKGYPVSGTVISKKGADWTDNVYAVYQVKIPEGWKTGDYRVIVYFFDVLNSSATYESYKKFFRTLINESEASINIVNLPRSEVDYRKKEIKFRIVDHVTPEVYLFDSGLKARVLPEKMNNTLQVSLFNRGSEKVNFYMNLMIDRKFFTKKRIELEPYSSTRVEFQIPQLEIGDHTLDLIPEWSNYRKLTTLPIYVEPYLFEKPLMVGKTGNGSVVLSLNNYILGSAGVSALDDKKPVFDAEKNYDMNRDNAAKTLTNIIAYFWEAGKFNRMMKIGLYYKSDLRAQDVLPKLLDYIKNLNRAPVEYAGVVSDYELDRVDILIYVSNNPDVTGLEKYIREGGYLLLDISDYYFDPARLLEKYALEESPKLQKTFYDFSTINKTVSIRLKTELRLPPEIKYSNLTVSDFIVDVGKPVKVSFDVRNEGGAGIADIYVKINDVIAFNQSLKIFQGERKHIEFEYVPEKEGSYKVVLDDTSTSKVFFAKNATKQGEAVKTPTPEKTKPVKRDPTLITALAGVLAVLIILRMYLRR